MDPGRGGIAGDCGRRVTSTRLAAFSEWVLKTEKSELVEREQQRKQQELGAAATTCLLAQQAVTGQIFGRIRNSAIRVSIDLE